MDNSRRSFLALIGMAAVATASQQALGQDFDLGHIWQVREHEPDGSVWEGTWTRRGVSMIFDAEWRNSYTGGIARDVIEYRGLQNGSVVLYRYRQAGYYNGPLSRDGTRIRHGSATWYGAGNFWEAQILD